MTEHLYSDAGVPTGTITPLNSGECHAVSIAACKSRVFPSHKLAADWLSAMEDERVKEFDMKYGGEEWPR